MADWKPISNFSAVVTIVAAAIGIFWFCVSVDRRIDHLEAQMLTISAAPSVQRSGNSQTVSNPIQQACAELARQASQEDTVSRSYAIDTMAKLSCSEVGH